MTIEFNFTTINKWLSGNGDIKDIDSRANTREVFKLESWKSCFVRSYHIDVLPNGESSDMYFHREKNIISNNIGGIDYLDSSEKGIERLKKNLSVGFSNNIAEGSIHHFLEKSNKIERVSWNRWREFISFQINAKPILLVPINEFGMLQLGEKLNNGSIRGSEESFIDVPISFSENNQPVEYIKVLRKSPGSYSVDYSNSLCSVSASVVSFEVEYHQ